jgi:hypothetical protein
VDAYIAGAIAAALELNDHARCGFGKTVVGIAIAALRVRTLVVAQGFPAAAVAEIASQSTARTSR